MLHPSLCHFHSSATAQYLDRSGVTNLVESIGAVNKVFNMGLDFAAFLSAYAVIFDGDPLTLKWSIGGPPPPSLILGLLFQPTGLSGSHNNYEGDTSIARSDAYLRNGDSTTVDMEFFMQMYNLPGMLTLSPVDTILTVASIS